MFRKSIALLAALCSCATVAHAGDKPLYAPAPAWAAPVPEIDFTKLTDSDPMLVVFDQQQRIEKGQVWIYMNQAVRVVSPQVLTQVGSITLPWQPDQGDLIVHTAQIVRGSERIDLLAKGEVLKVLQREEQLEKSQISGTLTATMAVEGLRVGDILIFRYSITRKDRALQGNVQTVAPLLPETVRARFARLLISWPTGAPVKWKIYSDGVTPKVTALGGFDTVEVAMPLPKQPEMPKDAPGRYTKLPMLESTSFADWAAVSRAMAPLFRTEGLIAPGSPLAGEVDRIAKASADPRVRTAAALRLVQDEIRYLLNAMDGGNYIPQTPAATWSLRYGDCKAKTLLLLAMLRQLGIEAEPVLASSSLGELVSSRLAAPAAFDHVLVRATIAGKSLWLDGTGSGSRIEDLDDTPALRTVLPLRTAGAALMPLEMRKPGRPMMEIDVEIDQRAGLGMAGVFRYTSVARGQIATMLQAVSSQATKEQLKDFVQTMVGSALSDAVVGDHGVRYDAATATATITASGLIGSGFERESRRYKMPLDRTVKEISFAPDRARAAWRDIPVAVAPDVAGTYRLRVRLPDGGKGFALEGNQVLPPVLGGVPIVRTAALADGWATVEDRFAPIGAEIAPADVAAARTQVALAKKRLLTVVAPETYPAYHEVVLAGRAAKAFDPVLAVYAKMIAEQPDEVQWYLNRANFLRGIYDWRGALADQDKAIALGDDAGALTDAEAAFALDPGNANAIGRVAQFRFRKGERDAALAMLDAQIAEGGSGAEGYQNLRADLLGEAGRRTEGLAVLDQLLAKSPGDAAQLNNRCWFKGTNNFELESALKDCMKGIELAGNPAAIYDSRAMVYYRMGKMEEALADLNAALEVAPSLGASLFLRGVVRRRMGDIKGSDSDLAAARMIWPITDQRYARWGIKP
jgi:tetratricopeptide (TPR) repeat protein